MSFTSSLVSASTAPTALREKLRDLSHPLSPLVQITTGYIHPAFPRMILNYYLLTSDELDSLMEFYHQKGDSEHMCEYPRPVGWEKDMEIERKRRRFGRFIGLRGCETPVRESFGDMRIFGEELSPWDKVRHDEGLSPLDVRSWEDAESPRKAKWYR